MHLNFQCKFLDFLKFNDECKTHRYDLYSYTKYEYIYIYV